MIGITVAGILLIVWSVASWAKDHGMHVIRQQAVAEGLAEWRPDENGDTRFHWNKEAGEENGER